MQGVTVGDVGSANRNALKVRKLKNGANARKDDPEHANHVEKHASIEKNARVPKFEGAPTDGFLLE